MNEYFVALGVATAFIGVLVVIEWSKRRLKLSSEITRRLAHISAGLLAIVAYLALPTWLYIVAISGVGLLIAVSQYKNIFTSIHSVRRRTYGELFLPAGLLAALAVGMSHPEYYIPSVLILTFADSFGGLVSDVLKQKRKMLRGSIVFFATALVILLVLVDLPVHALVLVAVAVTAIERYSPLGSDNLSVPLSTMLLLMLF
jgi:phytol kinase